MSTKSRFRPLWDKRTLPVLALTILLVLVFMLGSLLSYQHLRLERQEQARAQAQRMLFAFEAHSVRLLDYADGQLRAIRAYLIEHGHDANWVRFMNDIKAPNAERFSGIVVVIDRNGRIVYQSETPRNKHKALDQVSDLDHFQYFLHHPGDSLFIGATRLGRVTGKMQYRVARPITKNGVFDGLVVLTLLPEHITDFYSSTSLGPKSTVTMMTQDQKLIARQPAVSPEMYGRVLSNLTKHPGISTKPGEGGSVFGHFSSFDQLKRDLFYKNLADYPVTLVVGIAEQDLYDSLAGLRRNLIGLASIFTLFAIIVCSLILRMLGQNRRLENSEAVARQTAKMLQASEARLKSIFAASPDALLICDAQGTIVMANRQVEHLFGYLIEELLGQPVEVLLPTYSRAGHPALRNMFVEAPTYRTMGDGQALKARRKDGGEFDVEISLSPIQTEQGLFIACALRDITERKLVAAELVLHRDRLEELVASRTQELVEAKAAAERANNAKSRFLAAASHDLRQPLSALTLYASMLSINHPPSGTMVANMSECIASLSELLTDLLDLSKLEAGVVTPNIRNFPIAETLVSLESDYAPQAHAKGLELHCRLSKWTAYSDPILLRRILGNLIENAIRYTRHGGVLVACRRRQRKAWVEVWDTGIGISADMITEIFEEFKQLGDPARNVGSGLGLAIVAKTAALLGLEIKVRSRLGRGSVFAIELPLGLPAPATPAPAQSALGARALRIAVVDDNHMVRTALEAILRELGHQVVVADSKATLLADLGTLEPDIVVCDYRLARGETGFDVIAAVKSRFGAEVPAILITGDTDPSLLRNMAERGIPVLHKPLDLETLQEALRGVPRKMAS